MYCKNCNKETNNPRFCSRSCSASYNNRGVRRHGREPKPCPVCQKPTTNKWCCSYSCKKEYNWRQAQADIVSGKARKKAWIKRHMMETEGVCSECGQDSMWNGKQLVLQLDHIDGHTTNNNLDNLRLLCPNCHSQTPTWGTRNPKWRNGLLVQSGERHPVTVEAAGSKPV